MGGAFVYISLSRKHATRRVHRALFDSKHAFTPKAGTHTKQIHEKTKESQCIVQPFY